MKNRNWGSLVPSGKVAENTWNSRLANELNLKGFPSAEFELIFPVLRGIKKPDVAFTNGGTHLISGKLGEKQEFDAFSTAQEYQQIIGATTPLGEVFGVVYPASNRESFIIHLLANSQHERKVWKTKNFEDAVDIICNVVQERLDVLKRGIESADASVIRLLRHGVHLLKSTINPEDENSLKEVFGGADFFDSILSHDVPESIRTDYLTQAAAYLFVNQILFYNILSHETEAFPEINIADMSSPSKIRKKYFSKVLKKDYEPIFKIDLTPVFSTPDSEDGCLSINRVVYELSKSISTHDLIGKVFHEIIPLKFRKQIAAYYTNASAGDLLAGLSIESYDSKILDPACGSGTLLVSSYKRKWGLARPDIRNKDLHKKFLEEDITGLDVMAFSAHLAAVHLVLQEPLEYADVLRIGTLDSTLTKPGTIVSPFETQIKSAFQQRTISNWHTSKGSEKIEAGAVVLKGATKNGFELEAVDVVIMNPPFTSSRRMSSEYKSRLKNQFKNYPRYLEILKGNISYQAYFLCLADKFLKENGRIAAVLPFTTLIGGDYAKLTKYLISNYTIEYIVIGKGRSAFSENTSFSEILLVAKKTPNEENHPCILIQTKTSPSEWLEEEISELINRARSVKNNPVEIENDKFKIKIFEQSELLSENKTLTGLVAEIDEDYKILEEEIKESLENSGLITDFNELIKNEVVEIKVAEVVHGKANNWAGHSLTRFGGDALIICRSTERAIMKHDRLIFNEICSNEIKFHDKFTKDSYSYPSEKTVPALRRFSQFKYIDATDREDFAISSYDPKLDKIFTGIYGSDTQQYILDIKTEWEDVIRVGKARLCMPGRMDIAAPGTNLLALRSKNEMFMCSFMWGFHGLSEIDEKIMVLWLNSGIFLHFLFTHQTVTRGSWIKLHSKQLIKMPVLDIRKIPNDKKLQLERIYDLISDTEWPSLLEQYRNPTVERKKIDTELLKILGFNTNIPIFLEKIYSGIVRKLDEMVATMGGD